MARKHNQLRRAYINYCFWMVLFYAVGGVSAGLILIYINSRDKNSWASFIAPILISFTGICGIIEKAYWIQKYIHETNIVSSGEIHAEYHLRDGEETTR